MGNKVLVTGATGKVGYEVVKALAMAGVTVKAATRHPATAPDYGMQGAVEIVRFDYADPQTVTAALADVDRLFLVTPEDDEVAYGKRLVDAAQAADVTHIVKLSALGVEQAETSGHRQVERYIEASHLAYTHLRPTWFMQNFNTFDAQSIKEHDTLYLPASDGRVGFIDTRDIAAVAALALTREGHANTAYALTGPALLDHAEVAAILSQTLGRTITYANPSDVQYRAALSSYGMPPRMVEGMAGLYGMVRSGSYAVLTPDVERLLGRAPMAFSQYARDYAAIWQ
jgi:uncharacterized protein YbjT (DUF2867 family)